MLGSPCHPGSTAHRKANGTGLPGTCQIISRAEAVAAPESALGTESCMFHDAAAVARYGNSGSTDATAVASKVIIRPSFSKAGRGNKDYASGTIPWSLVSWGPGALGPFLNSRGAGCFSVRRAV